MLDIEEELREDMEDAGFKTRKLEKEMDEADCGFWDALFSFGKCITQGGPAKLKIVRINAVFVREVKIASSLNDKLEHFVNSFKRAHSLRMEASKLFEEVSPIKEALDLIKVTLDE